MKISKGIRSTRVLLPLVVLAGSALACNNPAANPDYIPAGNLTVNVSDQAGAAVPGATVDVLDAQGSFVWARGTSGSDGVVQFTSSSPKTSVPLLGGSYRVSLTAPAGYVVASAQTNPVSVQISDQKTTTLTMTLSKGS